MRAWNQFFCGKLKKLMNENQNYACRDVAFRGHPLLKETVSNWGIFSVSIARSMDKMFCDYGYEKKVLKVETSWRTVKVILKIRFDI